MKKGLVVNGPDVNYGPLALLSGTFEEKLEKAARLNFDGIELMVRDPDLLDWPEVKGCIENAGLEVPQVVTGELFGADGLCLVTSDPDCHCRAVERTKRVIDLAAYLDAMVNIGRLRGRLEYLGKIGDPWPVTVECMREITTYAGDLGVKITLEPLNRYETDFILTAADGIRMIEALGADHVGLMLDLFHMNIEEDSIESSLCLAGERMWHVHIADSQRRYPGSGHINFPLIFSTLKEMGYQGYVSAELLPSPDADTAAEKTSQFFSRYLP